MDGWLVGSDGLRYFSILRSLVFDQDVDLTNEYQVLGVREPVMAMGLPSCPFAIGMPLLWSPFYLLALALGAGLRALGVAVPGGGYGALEQAAVLYGTLFYGGAAWMLARRLGRRGGFVSERALNLALVTACWATPAVYYLAAEPSMSHGVTLFTITLFFALWFPLPPVRPAGQWFGLGLAAGLVALTRWQDAIILVIPLAELVARTVRRSMTAGAAVKAAAMLGLAFAVVLLPQFAMFQAIYGQALLVPQGNDFMDWGHPQWMASLFSTRHGLLTWHPWYLLTLASLVPLARRADTRALAWGIAACFALTLYANSASIQWWAGDAFGARRFTGLVPVLGLALAAGIDAVGRHGAGARRAVVFVLIALVGWNGLSALQYRLGTVSRDLPLTLREMTIDRLRLPLDLLRRR